MMCLAWFIGLFSFFFFAFPFFFLKNSKTLHWLNSVLKFKTTIDFNGKRHIIHEPSKLHY